MLLYVIGNPVFECLSITVILRHWFCPERSMLREDQHLPDHGGFIFCCIKSTVKALAITCLIYVFYPKGKFQHYSIQNMARFVYMTCSQLVKTLMGICCQAEGVALYFALSTLYYAVFLKAYTVHI